jgi:hypothetical protein
MPLAVFEPTIPVLGRAKIFHALDRAATVICLISNILCKIMSYIMNKCSAKAMHKPLK